MANQQLYTTAAVYLNDNLLSEAMNVSIKMNGAQQDIKTMAKGFAGVSKGAVMTEISVSNAIPQDGFEADVIPYIINVQDVKLTIVLGSSVMSIKGYIGSTDIEAGIDAASKQGFSFKGGEAFFE